MVRPLCTREPTDHQEQLEAALAPLMRGAPSDPEQVIVRSAVGALEVARGSAATSWRRRRSQRSRRLAGTAKRLSCC
jgi:hypothetical protein